MVVRRLCTSLLGLGIALLLWIRADPVGAQPPSGPESAKATGVRAAAAVEKRKPPKPRATPPSKRTRPLKAKRRKRRARKRRRRSRRRRSSRARRARKAPATASKAKKGTEQTAEAKLRALRRRHVGWLGRVAKKFPYWSKRLGPLRRNLAKARRAYWENRNDASVRGKYFKAAYRYLKKALLPYKQFRLKQAREQKRSEFTAKLQEQIAKIEARMAEFRQAGK